MSGNAFERVAQLEEVVTKLKAEVDTLRAAKTGAMRETQCCPSCGNRTILHFTQITERGNAGLERLSLAHERVGAIIVRINDAAPLQAFACRACGRVEWYATGLDAIEADGDVVRLLTSEPDAPDTGPYR